MDLLIKICGMRDVSNINKILTLNPDYIGFIFYANSPRYVHSYETFGGIQFQTHVNKTGVFVNASEEYIMQKVKLYNLQAVQLHGDEPVSLCKSLKSNGLIVLKAFQINEVEDFKRTVDYNQFVDYFLFDTKSTIYGGSGLKFDWSLLDVYQGDTPFFLSGGIGPDDAHAIKQINHSLFRGVDLNSRFEDHSAMKNYIQLQHFIKQLK